MTPIMKEHEIAGKAFANAIERNQSIQVNPKKKWFKVEHEVICVIKPLDDLENTSKYTYFKGKVLIEGSTEALMFKSPKMMRDQVSVKVVHTKTYKTRKGVGKANFRWIKGFNPSDKKDYQSHLK